MQAQLRILSVSHGCTEKRRVRHSAWLVKVGAILALVSKIQIRKPNIVALSWLWLGFGFDLCCCCFGSGANFGHGLSSPFNDLPACLLACLLAAFAPCPDFVIFEIHWLMYPNLTVKCVCLWPVQQHLRFFRGLRCRPALHPTAHLEPLLSGKPSSARLHSTTHAPTDRSSSSPY